MADMENIKVTINGVESMGIPEGDVDYYSEELCWSRFTVKDGTALHRKYNLTGAVTFKCSLLLGHDGKHVYKLPFMPLECTIVDVKWE